MHENLLEIAQDHLLEQVVEEPTRGENILDLLFLSNPGTLNRTVLAPGIGDHNIVYADIDIHLKWQTKTPRETLQYGKANWGK